MIGIIGGTGLYSMEGVEVLENRELSTPYGKPSAPVVLGRLEGKQVAFLPRHGLNHDVLPSEINYRANIWALKAAGVRRIISISATGSLREEIRPGDLALVSQYFDWTRGKRASTFFGDGLVVHISTAEPSCPAISRKIAGAASRGEIPLHVKKTYACVEGPRLGTQAESHFLRGAGCDLVGMTNVPEAFLAREEQLCYATIAVATDYDCWLEDPSQHVTVDKVIALYKKTLGTVKSIISETVRDGSEFAACGCRESLKFALLTQESHIPAKARQMLEFLRA